MEIRKVQKFDRNPFWNVRQLETRGKKIFFNKVSSHSIINHDTGQLSGVSIQSYKEVDSEEFVKIYTANVGLIFDLNPSGKKVFQILLIALQKNSINRDSVLFSSRIGLEIANKHSIKIGETTFYRGLEELLRQNIIAKSLESNLYFINPHIIFNGDRIDFINSFKRIQSIENHNKKGRIENKEY